MTVAVERDINKQPTIGLRVGKNQNHLGHLNHLSVIIFSSCCNDFSYSKRYIKKEIIIIIISDQS